MRNLKKCLGYFEIKHIDKPSFATIAVTPKEYYEFFEDNSFNKKHKDIKKGSSGMDFENFVHKILLVNDCGQFFLKISCRYKTNV